MRFKLFEELTARAEKELNKEAQGIPADIFERICRMDPRTKYSGDDVDSMGFGARSLLLPKYKSGEHEFVDNNQDEEVRNALTNYYANIATYPKFPQFTSVAQFLEFIANPEGGVELAAAGPEKTPVDDIYDKYYSKIPRETFNNIINLDSQTTPSKLGEVAKLILLPSYVRGDDNFLKDTNQTQNIIDNFYELRDDYPKEKQNPAAYRSIEELGAYKIESPILADIAANRKKKIIEGEDYIHIASTPMYDVFRLLSQTGSWMLAHNSGAENGWCTAGGSSGNGIQLDDNHEPTGEVGWAFNNYTQDGAVLYQFLYKNDPRNKRLNAQAQVLRDGRIQYFLDGFDSNVKGLQPQAALKFFVSIDPALGKAIANSNDNPICLNPIIQNFSNRSSSITSETFDINNYSDLTKFIGLRSHVGYNPDEVTIYDYSVLNINNIEEIPAGLCNSMYSLQAVNIGPGVKTIGALAFANTFIKTVTLPEGLEVIGKGAFANCPRLKGSIRIPDSVTSIREKAFFGNTKFELKINQNRTNTLQLNKNDSEFLLQHIKAIKL